MSPLAAFVAVFSLFVGPRLMELRLAGANARRLEARGGIEHGAGRFPWLVAAHGGYYAMLAAEVLSTRRPPGATGWLCLALLAPVLALRYWTLATLGSRWTIRVIVVPGERVVTRGPYRYLRHPNDLVSAAFQQPDAVLSGRLKGPR